MWWQRKQVEPVIGDMAPWPSLSSDEIQRDRLARRAYWEETNPVRTYRVTYMDGETRDVKAHSSVVSVAEGRVLFFMDRYSEYVDQYTRRPRDTVYWGLSSQIRSVEMIEG